MEQGQQKSIDQKNDHALSQALNQKINYLKQLKTALRDHNDLLIYKLLDAKRYYEMITNRRHPSNYLFTNLASDLQSQLSHYLSNQLINYLGQIYPFFYYDEYQLGRFKIYFGNWWDHKLFGKLDAVKIQFTFNQTEYDKLKKTFTSKTTNYQVNSQKISQIKKVNRRLKRLLASQNKRNQLKKRLRNQLKAANSKNKLPWESNKAKIQHQQILNQLSHLTNRDEKAVNAKNQIQKNESQILNLSKEDTILSYEKQSILEVFGSFDRFVQSNQHLYQNYLSNLRANNSDIDKSVTKTNKTDSNEQAQESEGEDKDE